MQSLPRPRTSKKSKDYVQITYDFSNKIHCSKIYPIPRPTNGSTFADDRSILILGHADGITVVWRGFPVEHSKKRKLKELEEKARSKQQGKLARETSNLKGILSESGVFDDNNSDVVMVSERPASQCSSFVNLELEKEALERKKTEDEAVVRQVNIATGVVAISTMPTNIVTTGALPSGGDMKPVTAKLIKDNIVVAVCCQDMSVRLISVPINPMTETEPEILKFGGLSGHRKPPNAVTMTLCSNLLGSDDQLLLASSSSDNTGLILLWRITIKGDAMMQPILEKPNGPKMVTLSSPATSVSFHPKDPNMLLISDEKGSVRTADLSAREPVWKALAQGRKVAATEWCLGGNGIVVLWAAGDWGVWTAGKVGYTYHKLGKITASAGQKKGFVTVTPHPVQPYTTTGKPEICVLCLNDQLVLVQNLQRLIDATTQKEAKTTDTVPPPPLSLDQPFLGGERILSVTSQILRSTIQSLPMNSLGSSFPSFSQQSFSQPSSQSLYMEPPRFRDQTQITILAPTTRRIHLLKLTPTFHATSFVPSSSSPGPSSQVDRFGGFSYPSGASSPSYRHNNVPDSTDEIFKTPAQNPSQIHYTGTPYPTNRYLSDDEMHDDQRTYTNGSSSVETRAQAKRKRLQESDPTSETPAPAPGMITGMPTKKRKGGPLKLEKPMSEADYDALERQREEENGREENEREREALGTATPSVKAFGFRVWG